MDSLYDQSLDYYALFIKEGFLDESALSQAGYGDSQIDAIRERLVSSGKLTAVDNVVDLNED